MQLKIHSDANTTVPEEIMDRPKRGKRKTSDSLATPKSAEKIKPCEPKANGDSCTPRRNRRKSTDKVEPCEPKMNGDTFTPRRSRRKISENSVSNGINDSLVQTPVLKIERLKLKENSRKISESSESPQQPQRPTGTKRKTSESGKTEAMSVADRIKLLSHDQNQKSTPPRTNSVLQLLLQGLNSKDKRILESVLERADEELIKDTVKKLPLEAILPLLEVLLHYIQGKVSLVFSHGKWLKAVLQHHTSYIMSSPECEEILASMNAIIDARTKNYNKILQLRGKLEMMVHQVTAQPEDEESTVLEDQINKEALLVYQDDDDDDDLQLDDMLMPASDTDNDDWDGDQNGGEDSDEDQESGDEDVVEIDDESDDEPLANGVSSDDDNYMDAE